MNRIRNGVKMAVIGLMVALTATILRADNCPEGSFAIAGSAGFLSTIEWNPNDPRADLAYYFLEDPTVNEGGLGDPEVFRGLVSYLCLDSGTCDQLDESFIASIHLSANIALGTNNCPLTLTDKRGVFIFTDSKGTAIVSVDAIDATFWDFDRAVVNSPTLSPALAVFGLEGRVLTRSDTLIPRITGEIVNADGTIQVALVWEAPQVWTDAPAVIAMERYDVLMQTVPAGSGPSPTAPLSPLADADGSTTNTAATILLDPVAGTDAFLFVRAEFHNSLGRAALSGPSRRILLDPGLAVPGKGRGKGKGLDTAPGQNR